MNLKLIEKLAKLANNNPNEHEANSAARRVCKLLAEGKFQFTLPENSRTWNDVKRTTSPDFKSVRTPDHSSSIWEEFVKSHYWADHPFDRPFDRPYPGSKNPFDIPHRDPPKKEEPKVRHRCIHCRGVMTNPEDINLKMHRECLAKEEERIRTENKPIHKCETCGSLSWKYIPEKFSHVCVNCGHLISVLSSTLNDWRME